MKTRRTTQQWRAIVEQQQTSGLSVVDFCQQHNIHATTFYNSRKKLERQASAFVKAKVTQTQRVETHFEPTAQVTLTHGNTQLSLSSVCEPVWLAQLIKALQS